MTTTTPSLELTGDRTWYVVAVLTDALTRRTFVLPLPEDAPPFAHAVETLEPVVTDLLGTDDFTIDFANRI